MAIYSLAIASNSWILNRCILEIRTAATDSARLLEMGFAGGGYGGRFIGLGRPQNMGVGPSSPITVLPENSSDAVGTVTFATNWGTEPTVPLRFFRTIMADDVGCAGMIWSFPKGIVIPPSSSIVLWNFSGTSGLYIWAVIDE